MLPTPWERMAVVFWWKAMLEISRGTHIYRGLRGHDVKGIDYIQPGDLIIAIMSGIIIILNYSLCLYAAGTHMEKTSPLGNLGGSVLNKVTVKFFKI
jgi:hypothetical protein